MVSAKIIPPRGGLHSQAPTAFAVAQARRPPLGWKSRKPAPAPPETVKNAPFGGVRKNRTSPPALAPCGFANSVSGSLWGRAIAFGHLERTHATHWRPNHERRIDGHAIPPRLQGRDADPPTEPASAGRRSAVSTNRGPAASRAVGVSGFCRLFWTIRALPVAIFPLVLGAMEHATALRTVR